MTMFVIVILVVSGMLALTTLLVVLVWAINRSTHQNSEKAPLPSRPPITALSDSEQHFRDLVESSSDWLWEINADGVYTYVSPQVERILGYTPAEILGKTPMDLMLPEEAKRIAALFQQLKENAEPIVTLENVNVHKDGRRVILETSGTPVLDADGMVVGYRGTDRDITTRKQAEEAMEKKIVALTQPLDDTEGIAFEELFNIDDIQRLQDEFSDATSVASIITHTDGTPITRPSNFCHLCKDIIRKTDKGLANCYKSDACLGCMNPHGPTVERCLSGGLWDAGASITVGNKHIANWLIGQVRDNAQTEDQMLQYAREIGADEETFIEAFRQVPGMSREHFQKISQVLFTLANQLSTTAYQNIQQARFITDRKRADAEREALLKTLKFKNRELQDIVYTASHDLRSPLVNIQGFSSELGTDCGQLLELLKNTTDTAETHKQVETLLVEHIPRSLDFITQSTRKMASLLDGLLQMSRIGTVEIALEPVAMNELMRRVQAAMEFQIQERHIDVMVEPLPDCIGDAEMLDRVFSNLLSNAVKYLEPAREGKISVSGHVENGMSVYCVADNGIGIAPGHQEKVFEIFHRLNPEDDTDGEGLGLTIVTRIIDRLGGRIRLESDTDQGCRFIVTLPTA